MVTQRLEKDLSKILTETPNIWFLKLQVNMRSFSSMPADYLVLTAKKRFLIECKETRTKRYSFLRSNQVKKMKEFHIKHFDNRAYMLFSFRIKRFKRPLYYLVDILEYLKFEAKIELKSASHNDFEEHLSECRIELSEIPESLYK